MRLLICGSRYWTNPDPIYSAIKQFAEAYPDLTIIQGGAKGADEIAKMIAQRLKIPCETFEANWALHGRRAGPIRNQQMLNSGVDLCLAFHEDYKNSKGTKDMLSRIHKAGVAYSIYPQPTQSI